MTDISDKDRTFEVGLDKGVVGESTILVFITVPASEDAEELCQERWDDLVGGHIDGWWHEVTGEEHDR